MEWLNFRHLYAFWTVKQEGGFKAAAEKINVSQSTISEQVTLLEEYFQKSLFQRDTRNLKLTEVGQELFLYANSIFEKSREINVLIRDERDSGSTNLRCGIIGGVSRNLVYRIIKGPLEDQLINSFDVYNGSLGRLTEACLNYEIDFFISVIPPQGKDMALFENHIIEKSPICLTGSKSLITKLKRERKKPIEMDLYHYSFPFLEGNVIEKIERKYNVRFNIKLQTDDISLLRFFANSEEGLSLVPEIGVMEDIEDRRLDKIDIKFVNSVYFYVVFPKVSAKKDFIEDIFLDYQSH